MIYRACDGSFRVYFVTEISDPQKLYKSILSTDKDKQSLVFLNASMIFSMRILEAAINKARSTSHRKTKSLVTEVIYSVSPSGSVELLAAYFVDQTLAFHLWV